MGDFFVWFLSNHSVNAIFGRIWKISGEGRREGCGNFCDINAVFRERNGKLEKVWLKKCIFLTCGEKKRWEIGERTGNNIITLLFVRGPGYRRYDAANKLTSIRLFPSFSQWCILSTPVLELMMPLHYIKQWECQERQIGIVAELLPTPTHVILLYFTDQED